MSKALDDAAAEAVRVHLCALGNELVGQGLDPNDFGTALLAATVDWAASIYGADGMVEWLEMNAKVQRGMLTPPPGGLQ